MTSLSPRYASNHSDPVLGLVGLADRPSNLSNDSPSYFFQGVGQDGLQPQVR